MSVNFLWVTIPCADLEKSVQFYHEVLGLALLNRFETEQGDIVMLGQEDGTKVELIQLAETQSSRSFGGTSIGFQVDNLQSTMERLAQINIPVQDGPYSPTPWVSFAFIHDPDGFRVQLVQRTN